MDKILYKRYDTKSSDFFKENTKYILGLFFANLLFLNFFITFFIGVICCVANVAKLCYILCPIFFVVCAFFSFRLTIKEMKKISKSIIQGRIFYLNFKIFCQKYFLLKMTSKNKDTNILLYILLILLDPVICSKSLQN